MNSKPVISVIVPAYNEEASINACIRALRRQTVGVAYEIIVSDNASTDQTGKRAVHAGARVVVVPQKGYTNALRGGIRLSRGRIIAVTDADCVPPLDWLTRIYTHFNHRPDMVAVGGPFSYYDGSVWVRRFVDFVNVVNPHLLTASLCGMNMAFRKDIYYRVGGLDAGVNLQVETQLGFRLMQEGRVIFDPNLRMRASGRRYQSPSRVFSEVSRRVTNAVFIRLTGKPIHYAFADVRG